MYKTKLFLDEKFLLPLHFSYIHLHINYANLVWAWYGQYSRGKYEKYIKQPKQALRIVQNKYTYHHTTELFKG